jgi:hypothetical protein
MATSIKDVMEKVQAELQNASRLNYIRDRDIGITESIDTPHPIFTAKAAKTGILIYPETNPENYEARMGQIVRVTFNCGVVIILKSLKMTTDRIMRRSKGIEEMSHDVYEVLMFNNLNGLLRSNPVGNVGNIQILPTESQEMSLRLLPFSGIKHERVT